MKLLEKTQLTVEMQEMGKEKLTTQPFSNIVDNPDEDKIYELGEIITAFAPFNTTLNSVLKTETTRYY